MRPQTIRKRVSDLKHGPNIRSDLGREADLIRHGHSVKKRQRTPLLILPDGTVLDGNRTLAAARLVGIEELDCVVIDASTSPAEYKTIQWMSNVHRQDIAPCDKAVTVRDIAAEHPGMTNKQLAEEVLDIDPSMVPRLLSLFDCIPEVREAARQGRLGVSDWYAISKAETPEEQAELLARKLAGASRDEIEREGRKRRNGPSTVRTSSIRMTFASGITLVLKGKDISLDDAIEALPEAQKEMRKAREQGHDVKTFQALLKKRETAAS